MVAAREKAERARAELEKLGHTEMTFEEARKQRELLEQQHKENEKKRLEQRREMWKKREAELEEKRKKEEKKLKEQRKQRELELKRIEEELEVEFSTRELLDDESPADISQTYKTVRASKLSLLMITRMIFQH